MIESLLQHPDIFALRALALLLSLVLHEWGHAYAAFRLGDRTASDMGRLSFNPLKHIDYMGAAFLLFFGFGWAKPVQFDPRNFKNQRSGIIIVALAGIVLNLILFFIASFAMIVLAGQLYPKEVIQHFGLRYLVSFYEGIGAAGLYIPQIRQIVGNDILYYLFGFFTQLSLINIALAFFNLLPIPPLDGSHVVNQLFFKGRLYMDRRVLLALGVGIFLLSRYTDIIGRYIMFMGKQLQEIVFLLMGV